MSENQLESALDLMRRLPPSDIEDNLGGLIDLCPDLTEQLLSAVDQPLAVEHDKSAGRDFLLCDYNRDGDSYRSPWSNKYFPELSDGAMPSAALRKTEIGLNDMFDAYRDSYYEGGTSSVYCWDIDGGFAACILIKKGGEQAKRAVKGTWDSIHVVEVALQQGGSAKATKAEYKLTSTVMLSVTTATTGAGNITLAGSLTRQVEDEKKVDDRNTHLVNIGHLVEDMEARLRGSIEEIYFGKTKSIVGDIRQDTREAKRRADLQQNLKNQMMNAKKA